MTKKSATKKSEKLAEQSSEQLEELTAPAEETQSPAQESETPETTAKLPQLLDESFKASPKRKLAYLSPDGKGWYFDKAQAARNFKSYHVAKNPYA